MMRARRDSSARPRRACHHVKLGAFMVRQCQRSGSKHATYYHSINYYGHDRYELIDGFKRGAAAGGRERFYHS
jgi:hypothetical protein